MQHRLQCSRTYTYTGTAQTVVKQTCFYFCSKEWNSEHFYLLWNGSERNSESFVFRGTAGIPPELTICSVYSVFRGKIFWSEIANPSADNQWEHRERGGWPLRTTTSHGRIRHPPAWRTEYYNNNMLNNEHVVKNAYAYWACSKSHNFSNFVKQ
jgi:hypothetical protein